MIGDPLILDLYMSKSMMTNLSKSLHYGYSTSKSLIILTFNLIHHINIQMQQLDYRKTIKKCCGGGSYELHIMQADLFLE